MSGRKLARRACDGCKIRKIKCSETSPCTGCHNAGIACTWLKQSQARGPRRLRDATLQEIRKAQDILQNQSREAARKGTTRSPNVDDPDPPPQPSSEISQLVLYLCVYRVQLYPVWPVIKVERLIASLQSESPDIEVFALAYALAAATASRTHSTDLSISKRNHARMLERKCQAAKAKVPPGRPPNLTTVRIAFFLHIYYESLEANSMKSMLYLREAVTIATMIGLHKESYYLEVPNQEREIRRRVLWLLFVTERVISILHEQPVTLRTKIELPSTTDTDEVDVLAGFQMLVKLFWKLDESGFFDLLDELEVQASPSSSGQSNKLSSSSADFTALIQADAGHIGYIPPVQTLDLAVTRCWLHIMNLRIQQAAITEFASSPDQAIASLLTVLEDMMAILERSSAELVEAHGSALQLKISTISGVIQEILALPADTSTYSVVHKRCSALLERLGQTFAGRADKTAGPFASTPLSAVRSPSYKAASVPSPDNEVSVHSMHKNVYPPVTYERFLGNNNTMQTSAGHQSAMPRYPSQDFAVNNNYEGLFEAVQLAGVHSSDSVNDLFDEASFEQYGNIDDTWSGIPDPGDLAGTTYEWQAHQASVFDFG